MTLEPLVGARVRFRTGLGTPWRNGMLNQTRTVPACFMVLLWSGGRLRRTQVPIDSIGALQVSSLYAIARRYEEPDTTAGAAEQWLDVPAEMMGAAAARCGRMYR